MQLELQRRVVRAPGASKGSQPQLHPLQRLQSQAGNRAVARLVALQRDPTGKPGAGSSEASATAGPTAAPAPSAEQPVLRIDARQVPQEAAVPPPSASAAPATAPPGTGTTTPSTTAAPAATAAANQTQAPQFQVQYGFVGQAATALGPGRDPTASALSAQHQLAVIINVQHHDNNEAGREDSYALQATVDPVTGLITGGGGQFQEALVTATRHHLQGQLFGNATVGATEDLPGPGGVGGGTVRPFAGVGGGVQGNVVINENFTLWASAGVGANVTSGPGGPGSGGGAVFAPNAQAGAGITITLP